MRLRIIFFTIIAVAFSLTSSAQLLQWNTFGNAGTETTEPSVFNNANIVAANLTQGTITAAANGDRFGGSGWFNTGNTAGGNTLAEAVAGNDYIQFVVTPNAGFSFTPTSFVFGWDHSGTGPKSVTLRSSVDGYAADLGSVTGMAASQTNANTITISGLANITTATTFRLYGYGATATGGTGGFDVGSNVVNVQLNGTTTAVGPYTVASGDWANPATWSTNPSVPTNTDNVTITAGHVVYTGATLTRTGTTTVNGTFQLDENGYATGTAFTYGAAGTLNFNKSSGSYDVANGDVFWPAASGPVNVNVLQGGLTMNSANRTVAGIFSTKAGVTLNSSALTIGGTCRIDAGGFFSNVSPTYTTGSLLLYNTASVYNRQLEWTSNGAVAGAGTPYNVQISNNTTLNYINGSNSGAKAIVNNLTIDAGSSLYMDYGNISSAGALSVGGNFTNNGNFSMGFASGDDLKLAGNFVNTGTFNGNNRAVFFIKNGTQTVSSTTALTIPYVVFQPASGSTTVQLLSNVTVSAPLAGNAISFNGASDVFDINNNTLTIGTAGLANVISGAGTFKGSATSNLALLGTESVGTLKFAGSLNLGTFTVDRTAGAVGCVMGSALTVNTTLALTNGIVDLGNNVMTIAAAATITGASSSNFVIADVGYGTTASLQKIFSAAGNFTYPIGDRAASADGMQYSPITATFTGGSYGGYAGFAVDDIKEPNMDAAVDYLTRYWNMTTSGISPASYSVTGIYLPVDIVGTEANSIGNQWNGASWLNNGAPIGSNTMTIGGITTYPATNHFTAGLRNAEINIKVVAANYLTGSTYDFGTQFTGSNTSVTFTIENFGQQSLTLAAATFTGNPNYVYTTAYTSPVSGPSGTKTFVVTFSPSGAGTFTGSISITNNDPTGAESPYVINFTGIAVVPAPEINVKGIIASNPTIMSGDITPSSLDNTQFAATAIGSNQTKTFRIENIGSLVLNVSSLTLSGGNPGDFSITASAPYSIPFSGTNYVDFTITFAPTLIGLRTTTVSIASDDTSGGESPYTFVIEGNGTCATATNTITPISGPVGTEVTITASANNLTGATAAFNGISAVVTPIDATHIKVIVPAGAISGNLVTANAQGCTATNTFTVINNVANGCQGGNTTSELFFSEVTDATSGGLTYVEIYNGTGASVNLGSYSIKTANNGGAYGATLVLSSVPLANGSIYVVSFGSDGSCSVPGGNGSLANQTGPVGGGINFDVGQNDHFGLFKGAVLIDSYGIFGSTNWADGLGLGDRGATFRRKNTVTVPNATYSNSDWNIIDWTGTGMASCSTNDYTDIGTHNFITGTPPTVTTQPSYTPSCKATSFTVAGTEGFAGGTPLAYQWYAVAPGSTTWTALTNVAPYSGTTTVTLGISSIAGLDGYQYYCQIRENGATCYTASNAIKLSEALTVTWNGTTWSPSAPTIDNIVVINGNYNTATNGSFEACSVIVNGGSTLTVSPSNYVSIQNDLTVSASANLQVSDQGSLVMIDNAGVVTNSGTTNIVKTTSPYNKYDYTYWSSPVTNATLGATFPLWRTDYEFQFVTGNYADVVAPLDGFDDDGNAWQYAPTATVMTPGKGYAVMAPSTGTFPATSTVTFSGAVNNGIINIPMTLSANGASNTDDFNLIGNPYPSAIYANDFINANPAISGTLYFWTHRTGISNSNPGPDANNFITADYAMYNLTGGTSSGTGSATPTGYVASGQGFFVDTNGATNALFNNSMRNKTYSNSLFYRTAAPATPEDGSVKDRVWINLQNTDGLFSQQLLGYFDNTTLGYDRAYDGIVSKTSNTLSFYSFIDGDKYRIQARPAFDVNDVVPLGYSSTMAGTFSIAIDNREGALADAATNIFLEDKLLGIIHDLKQSGYSFTTAAGTFDSRFVLRYINSALGTVDLEDMQNNVVVATSHSQILIKSYLEEIADVTVYDILGRQVFSQSNVNNNQLTITDAVLSQQALIVKVRLENGIIVNRKIVF